MNQNYRTPDSVLLCSNDLFTTPSRNGFRQNTRRYD